MRLRLGATGSRAADCDVCDPDKQAANDDGCDQYRAATDIANSGVPTKVGMKLTDHKTVAMFMHYVHTEDKPVRDAAELVASRRSRACDM
ncbi:hypothetical protein [Burkholderia gladioli]|uniref:hypothetical protein n=1 Tax=Burkholderia gladioli TaxID=28095 RepID=UPI0034DB6A84